MAPNGSTLDASASQTTEQSSPGQDPWQQLASTSQQSSEPDSTTQPLTPDHAGGDDEDEATVDEDDLDAEHEKARVVAEMWRAGWAGNATITPERLVDEFADSAPAEWFEALVDEMFADDDCPLVRDPTNTVGREGTSVAVSPDPVVIAEFVSAVDADLVPTELARMH